MLEMRHLAHAVALAEHRNFARAAKSLNLSQPALSRSIQALESQLGLKLFDRNRKGVEPTEGGLLLLKRARDLIAQAEELEAETSAISRGFVGETKIAVGPYPAKMLVGPAVGALLAIQKDLRFRILVDNWANTTRLLRERDVDLAVCDTSEVDQTVFEITPLRKHQVYGVVREGHPLRKDSIRFQEVNRWPLGVTAALPPRVLGRLNSKRDASSQPTAVHCEDLEILKGIVSKSDVVMFLPLCLFETELEEGLFRPLPLEEPWLKTEYGIIKLKGRTLPPVSERIIEGLQNADQECFQKGEALREKFFVTNFPRRTQARSTSKGTSVIK